MSKKRIIVTGVCAGLCVVLCVVLGILLWQQSSNATITNTNKTLDEMLPIVEYANVKQIDIKNQQCEYTLINVDGTLVLEDNPKAQLEVYKLNALLSNVCQTYYTFSANVSEEEFINYGLGNGEHQAEFHLSTLNGKEFTVYIGNETLAKDGYYVRVPDKDSVYVLGYGIEKDLLGTPEYLIDFGLVFPTSMNTYFLVNNFSLKRNGEQVISMKVASENERSDFNIMGIHLCTYPEGYYGSMLYMGILQKFSALDSLGSNEFMASEIYSFNVDYETLARYGINPYGAAYELYFETPLSDENGMVVGYLPNMLYFSEKHRDESGAYFYYVYTPTQGGGKLGRIEALPVDFFDWTLEKWLSPYVFQTRLALTDTVYFSTPDIECSYKILGEDTSLAAVELPSGNEFDISNIQNLWMSLLVLTHDGYCDLSDAEKQSLVNSEKNNVFTLKIVTKAGQARTYKFYQYSDVRAFYTINGQGEFYVPMPMLNKIINDVHKLVNGEIINPESNL